MKRSPLDGEPRPRLGSLVVLVLMGACVDQTAIDVEQAEHVARQTGEKVVAGIDVAREKVEAVGGDLRDAAGEAARTVSDAGAVEPATADAMTREASAAITCPTAERCVVDAAFVDRIRANPAFLAGQARVAPHLRDGRADGLEISGLEAVPKSLGFHERDVIHSINGLRVQSLQSAPQLYLQLRSARRFTVVYSRGSEQHTRDIDVG